MYSIFCRYLSQLPIVDSESRNGVKFSRQDDITTSPPRMHTTRRNNSQSFPRQNSFRSLLLPSQAVLGIGNSP